MLILIITGVSALVPSLLLAWYFYSHDVRREPARAVWSTFGLGVMSIAPTLLVDWPISKFLVSPLTNPFAYGPAEAFLVAAIPEEFFKFCVLYWYARRRRWFDEPMDGVVYGAIASLGFATFENVLYCMSGGLFVAGMRAVTSVPGHAFWGAIMGYFVGIAHFSPPAQRGKWLLRALGWPILLHGAYDTGLLVLKSFGEQKREPVGGELALVIVLLVVSLAVVVLSWVLGIKLTRRMRRAQQLTLPGVEGPPGPPQAQPSPEVLALAAIWPRDTGAHDAPALPEPPRAPKTSRPLAWLMLLAGGLLIGGGSLMLLGSISVLAQGKVSQGIVGGLLFGLLPIGVGLRLFSRGLRRLPKRIRTSMAPSSPAPSPAVPGPPTA
jgi:RsiW-degrading membrane proteinase PrsW (M82 family)